MSNYTKGRRAEYKVMRILEVAGYDCIRSSGSHTLWDVVAINKSQVRFIQVKINCKPIPAEKEAMELFIVPDNCSKELWVFRDYIKMPDIKIIK